MAPPRKHSTLTLKDKLRIIEMLDKGDSYPIIARKFGIGRSTVGDIKKNKDKILKFVVVEDALFAWFLQQSRLHVPGSGDIIREKARMVHRQITNSNIGFNASWGWLEKFKKRHGIRLLKMVGEKLSNQTDHSN